jgi:uncharacterized membrane protein
MSDPKGTVRYEHDTDKGMALVIYILYLVGLVAGITYVVGVIMAYVNRGGSPDWLASHYSYQIRTFWIGLLFSVISSLLIAALVGYVLLLLTILWLIIRCAKGITLLNELRPVPNVITWAFP